MSAVPSPVSAQSPLSPTTAASSIERAKEVGANVITRLSSFTGENALVVILILAFALLFIIVIIYISFKIKSSSLKGKNLTHTPLKLDKMAAPYEVPGSMIPTPAVGIEYSFGWWMYIENVDQTGSGGKMIFYRGESGNLINANPVVMMDAVTNKLYIVLKSANSSLSSSTLPAPSGGAPPTYESDLGNILKYNCFMNKSETTCLPYMNKHVIIPVDYVPLQRWVHVLFTVDNKLVTVYMDGEIYSVKSVDELRVAKNLPENLVFDKTTGSIFVGKNPIVGNGSTMTGYLSRLSFFNYSLSLNDVKSIYAAGPLKRGPLSVLGVNNYGVRNPIYRLDELQDN